MQIALILLCSLVGVMGQRSPYLSSASQQYPGILNRFKTNDSESGLGDRFGGSAPVPAPAEGTLHDKETLDRIAQWPKEKQPFWYVNRVQIAQHYGTKTDQPSGQTSN